MTLTFHMGSANNGVHLQFHIATNNRYSTVDEEAEKVIRVPYSLYQSYCKIYYNHIVSSTQMIPLYGYQILAYAKVNR